ncbi:MAG: hypothetical protein FJ125_13590 [Deltaproteobacteria bacterium]|nr:hypothetical protein [Deltaproteobacteria bacterium]
MQPSELQRRRDAYVDAFNRGALEELEELLHPQASYRWVAAGKSEEGRARVMALYRYGLQAFQGQSRLSAVTGSEDQAVWWEPTPEGLQPRGLQQIRLADGLIVEIADEHEATKVAEAARRR